MALIAHGSDVRLPSRHMDRLRENSFFTYVDRDYRRRYERLAARNLSILEHLEWPVFVSTIDLLHDIPHGTWLPVVVHPAPWRGLEPAFPDDSAPRVLHVPSRRQPSIKGTAFIEPVLEELDEQRVIKWIRTDRVTNAEMIRLVEKADVVVDQIHTGGYGVAAVEAMTAGRLVIGNVSEDTRRLMPEQPPIIDATAMHLRGVLSQIAGDIDHSRAIARQGPGFADRWHSGAVSASQLDLFLSSRPMVGA